MPNIYEMSDEELLNADPSIFVDEVTEEIVDESDSVDTTQTESTDTQDSSEQTDSKESNEEYNTNIANDTNSNQADTVDETTDNQNNQANQDAIDYEAFYTEFTKPFKANGKQIQIANIEDAKALMQQGINYSKKMAQLKPSMGILKTLEANGLMNESELAYLIDLKNKNPEAIAKLVRDSEIDLYSFDTDKADNYIPQTQVESYSELEEVVNELQTNSNEFPRVLNDIITTWDNESKAILDSKPQVLKFITEHAEIGLYDKIVDAINYEKMLGRMQGVSFLDAYAQIESTFINAGNTGKQEVNQSNQSQAFTAPRPNGKQIDAKSVEQKRKASTPTNSNHSVGKETFNPLAVSDEELLEFMIQQQKY